jgi:hypothetical protein
MVQAAQAGGRHPVLSAAMVDEMLTPGAHGGHGLGPEIFREGTVFGHGGSNVGFRCTFRARVDGGEGIVIMTNANSGGQLAEELLLTVAREYGWDLRPRVMTPIDLDAEQLGEYVGSYVADEPWRVRVERTDRGLIGHLSWSDEPEEIVPDGKDHFFARSDGSGVEFVREQGAVVAVRVQGFEFRREPDPERAGPAP